MGTYDTVRDNLFDEYGVRTKDYRKLFYRVCKDLEVPMKVCDFYQFRIARLSIGDVYYDDFLLRADKYYPCSAKRLKGVLGLVRPVLVAGTNVSDSTSARSVPFAGNVEKS